MSELSLANRWLNASGLLVAFSLCVLDVCSVVRELVNNDMFSTMLVRPMYLPARCKLCYSKRRVSPENTGSGVGLLELLHGLHFKEPKVGHALAHRF
jgi:hypothetical protein